MKRLSVIILSFMVLFVPNLHYGEAATKSVTEEKANEASISKEQALEIASKAVAIPADYKQQNIEFNTNWYMNQGSVWNMYWYKESDLIYGHISVTIDAETGDILAMSHNENNREPIYSYPPKVSLKEAEKIAHQFVKNKFPKIAEQLKYDDFYNKNQKQPLSGNVIYYLRFDRTVNDIPYRENFVNVNIDANGKVIGFDYRWDNKLEFPTFEKMLSKDEAIQVIGQTLPFQLQYKILYPMVYNPQHEEKPNVVLEYNTAHFTPYLDAITGQWLSYTGEIIEQPGITNNNEPLAKDPIQQKEVKTNMYTQKEALAILQKHFDIPADYVLENASFSENWGMGQQTAWNFNWRSPNHQRWLYATVDGKTGTILNYSEEDPSRYNLEANNDKIDDTKGKISYEDAKEIAINAVKKLAPSVVDQLTFNTWMNDMSFQNTEGNEIYFNFHRIVNGVLFLDNSISLTVDLTSKKVFRYHRNWFNNIEFPTIDEVVPVNEAQKTFLSNYEIEPQYMLFFEDHYKPFAENSNKKPTMRLVYQLRSIPSQDPIYLDAVKGKWVSMRTGEVIKEQTQPTDINNHWAKEEIELLVSYGAIAVDEKGNVFPNEKITKGEMIKMLMLTMNPDPVYFEKVQHQFVEGSNTFSDVTSESPYFVYVESAVQRGLLDKSLKTLNPEETVTREELAKMIVKALGLDKLAQIEEMFKLSFTDNDKITFKGHLSIVSHLQIMVGENNKFYPKREVTRAEAATAYYQFLKKRSEIQPQTYNYY